MRNGREKMGINRSLDPKCRTSKIQFSISDTRSGNCARSSFDTIRHSKASFCVGMRVFSLVAGSAFCPFFTALIRTFCDTMRKAKTGLATQPEGFTSADLAEAVRGRMGWDPAQYPTRRAAYDLAKVRAKGLVERVAGRRRYECRPPQLRVLRAYVILRDQVIKPVLAGLAHSQLPPPPPKLAPIDQHYLTLRAEFQRTCQTLGLAA